MSAIITDQLRILNASNFVAGVGTTTNNYYAFIGLPNPTELLSDWDTEPPAPIDSFDEENDIWDTMIALKKIEGSDTRQIVRKISWSSGTTYEMYRHDYSRNNPSPITGATNLYDSDFYVMNSDFRVYICLSNGVSPENPDGRPSLDEPTFTDLEPRSAGSSGDGYIWKYLFTISPSEIVKFESSSYIPLPSDWFNNNSTESIRENAASSGQIKVVTITDRGAGYGTATSYSNVPVKGDGNGATATVTVNADGKIEAVDIEKGGSNYTFGTLDLDDVGLTNSLSPANFNVIIPPQGNHGSDIYRELGGNRVMLYARMDNDDTNPDFITGNQFARVGVVKDPLAYDSVDILTQSRATAVGALKVTAQNLADINFVPDAVITQTIGLGSTAVGRVISWDSTTGVIKYWQDRTLGIAQTAGELPEFGNTLLRFQNSLTDDTNGDFAVDGGTATVAIDTAFSGITTTINNRTYNLGQTFELGVSNPEVRKYTGDVIYVDNRPQVTRSVNQKEDIKVILEF